MSINQQKQLAKKELEKLVTQFRDHLESYKSSDYNEENLRTEFLNGFFGKAILGWDIENSDKLPPSYREVRTEESIQIEGRSKSPDYSFRINGTQRVFFVEAKKPAVNVSKHGESAFQLRRYGWNADLSISILTSFEYFAVYDCTIKPKDNEKATFARLKIIHFEDYLSEFDYIYDNFSKASVVKGSINNFAKGKKGKRGTASVDKDFLCSLDKWRIKLAHDLNEANSLDEEQLNSIVQKTLDKIIFLRIAEDRSAEEYGKLLKCLNTKNQLQALTNIFREADEKYNSGLFKEDSLNSEIKISNETITAIIRGLYYPTSPYEFSVLPIEIIGKAYEQFLGKQITLTKTGSIKIAAKPEVRKAGGVYYTPKYVVDYIVSQTVGKLCEGKTPDDVAQLKILDPASGSGSFLISAYEYLLNWHKDYFTKNKSKLSNKFVKSSITPAGDLTTKYKGQILLNNIYGVDIDANAIEVTKLSLLLKCLEGETKDTLNAQMQLFHERLLPTLDENIRCGNSLIDYDIYTELADFDEDIRIKRKINAFSWRAAFKSILQNGGFDAVIGNPPYDVLEKERLGKNTPHSALHKYIEVKKEFSPALGGKLNLYRFFLIKFVNLTKMNGKFGLIVPTSLLADISCRGTRSFVLKNSVNLEFDCFPQKDIPSKRIFYDAKLSTVILAGSRVSENNDLNNHFIIRTYPENSFDQTHKSVKIGYGDLNKIDSKNLSIPLIDEPAFKLMKKIYRNRQVTTLAQQSDLISIRRGEINQTNFKKYIQKNKDSGKRLIKGVQIGPYRINQTLSQGKVEWFNEAKFLREKEPNTYAHIRRIATQRITGVDERLRIVAAIVEPISYFADSTNSISISKGSKYSLEFLLGLLNSKLYQWRFKVTSTNNNVGTNELAAMPFRIIDLANTSDKHIYSSIEESVLRLLELNKNIIKNFKFVGGKMVPIKSSNKITQQAIDKISNEISFFEDRINELVYQLFDLSDKDKNLIEGAQNE